MGHTASLSNQRALKEASMTQWKLLWLAHLKSVVLSPTLKWSDRPLVGDLLMC